MKPWRAIAPFAVAVTLALLPVPAGLDQHAWYYFAIFAGVIAGIMAEPLPGGAVGLIGVVTVAVLAPFALFSPEELSRPGFRAQDAALNWALAGFSNATVWLIFAAFMFGLGYGKTGLGKRIALMLVKLLGKSTLSLGYAVAIADAILAPFTPSSTARSAGTIYPIIRNLPELYDSKPNDPSARKIGSYIMWVGIAASNISNSLFLTASAPNLLAAEMIRQTYKIDIDWMQWFLSAAPFAGPLLLSLPLLTYWLYPPQITRSENASEWAGNELVKMGSIAPREITVGLLVTMALALWIFGGSILNTTTVALIVVALMLATKVFTWEDMLRDAPAWNTFAWFATLVTLADGLNRVGFAKWFAEMVAAHLEGVSPVLAMAILIAVFFYSHYMFASITAHVAAVLPVMLAVGATIPDMPMRPYAMLLCLTLGIMGIISPYGSGQSPAFYGSGYLPTRDFWRLGTIFGSIFFATFLAVALPWVLFLG
jgi:L-tartrate/succinate antiporter